MWSDLARRAVACRHWRWMPGMLTTGGSRYTDYDDHDMATDPHELMAPGGVAVACGDMDGRLPDLDDKATVGCLLAIVREAWSAPDACPDAILRGTDLEWSICAIRGSGFDNLTEYAPSEAEALVMALEAAP